MITALGLGTKQAPDNVNLDPQRQFWSWLSPFVHPDERSADSYHHQRGYFSGFACTQTNPAGMSIQIGGRSAPDSALLVLTNGRCVLLSTDGTPQTVTIPTAPASGSRIDAVVSYIDTSSPSAEDETPGTPEYVHTIVVSGTASGSPSAPTDSQIVSALPAGANAKYYRWCDVRVAQGATVITNSNITDKKPASPNVYWTTSDITDIADEAAEEAVAPFANWNKVATITRDFGYAKQATLIRVGNIVICKTTGGNGKPAAGTWFDTGIKCPGGYKPRAGTVGTITGILPGGGGACVWVQTVPAGKVNMSMLVSGDLSASNDYQGVGVWVTSDAWPS